MTLEYLPFPCPFCKEFKLVDSNVPADHKANWPYYCTKCDRNVNYLLCSCDKPVCDFYYCKPDKFLK